MNTTLNEIKAKNPCQEGWQKLLKYLNKTEADNEPLELKTILESNGVADTIWALRCVEGHAKEIRLMAADFAESVLHLFEKEYPNDLRPRKAINAARDYANGKITVEELEAAWEPWSAAWEPWSAAWAAREAARAAARAAAWEAARAAAWAAWAAWEAARVSAGASEIEKQKEILLKYI